MSKAPTEIRSLARSHTESAIKVLASIMNQPKASHAARVSAAVALLDRRDRNLLDAAAVAAQEPHEAGEVRPTPRPRERDLGSNGGIQVIKVAGAVRIANPRFRVLERQRDRRWLHGSALGARTSCPAGTGSPVISETRETCHGAA